MARHPEGRKPTNLKRESGDSERTERSRRAAAARRLLASPAPPRHSLVVNRASWTARVDCTSFHSAPEAVAAAANTAAPALALPCIPRPPPC